MAKADVDPAVSPGLQLEAVADADVGQHPVQAGELGTERARAGPYDESVAGQPAVIPQEHVAVLDESDERRAIAKPPLDVAAEIVARTRHRKLGPGHVVRADAGLDLPGDGATGPLPGVVLPVIEQVGLVLIVPAEPAAVGGDGEPHIGATPRVA